jgi:GTP-binding protein HflX
LVAFRATLEELESADLLLHVIDISNPRYLSQINSVERLLGDLKLQHTPTMRVLNKIDRVDPDIIPNLTRKLDGMAISARQKSTLLPLINRMEAVLFEKSAIKANANGS